MLHHLLGPSDGIHPPFHWIVANIAARNALVPVAADVYKALWQSDTNTIYILTSVSPITWVPVSGSAAKDKARISKTNAQNSAANALSKVLFNTISYDIGLGIVDIANSRIVPKQAGQYLCSWRTSLGPSTNTRCFTSLMKAGAEASRGIDSNYPPGNIVLGSPGSDIITCNGTTDAIEVSVYSTVATGLEAFDFTSFLSVIGPL